MSVEVAASGASAIAKQNKERQAKEATAKLKSGLKAKSGYIKLSPDIRTQYPLKRNKVGYLNVAIQLKLETELSGVHVEEHQPAIHQAFVELVSSQPPGSLRTIKGREMLRGQAKQKFKTIMKELTGEEVVTEVYFTKFLAR
mgnify:FL=1